MRIQTHNAVDNNLCGRVVEIREDRSTVELELSDLMRADYTGLVHGGFIFGAADYAAMLAVNDPNVVLGSAESKFLHPCRVGDRISFEAVVDSRAGRRCEVSTVGRNSDGVAVFSGRLTCVVLSTHVLDKNKRSRS